MGEREGQFSGAKGQPNSAARENSEDAAQIKNEASPCGLRNTIWFRRYRRCGFGLFPLYGTAITRLHFAEFNNVRGHIRIDLGKRLRAVDYETVGTLPHLSSEPLSAPLQILYPFLALAREEHLRRRVQVNDQVRAGVEVRQKPSVQA